MYVYNKTSKPISLRLPTCAYQNCKIETQNELYFIYDLLEEYEGVLIVETYNRESLRFVKIESTVELQLICDKSSPLDYYELPQSV